MIANGNSDDDHDEDIQEVVHEIPANIAALLHIAENSGNRLFTTS